MSSRHARSRFSVPITSLVDVLLILLIFFMVTSTYLDLDMIPLAERAEATRSVQGSESPETPPLLIRLDSGGVPRLFGAALDGPGLVEAVRSRPGVPVVVLPSSGAPLQSLVDLFGALDAAGAGPVSVVPLGAGPP